MIYGWLWRHLPGPIWAKYMGAAIAIFVVVVVLFQWVFPWIEPLLPFEQQTVGG